MVLTRELDGSLGGPAKVSDRGDKDAGAGHTALSAKKRPPAHRPHSRPRGGEGRGDERRGGVAGGGSGVDDSGAAEFVTYRSIFNGVESPRGRSRRAASSALSAAGERHRRRPSAAYFSIFCEDEEDRPLPQRGMCADLSANVASLRKRREAWLKDIGAERARWQGEFGHGVQVQGRDRYESFPRECRSIGVLDRRKGLREREATTTTAQRLAAELCRNRSSAPRCDADDRNPKVACVDAVASGIVGRYHHRTADDGHREDVEHRGGDEEFLFGHHQGPTASTPPPIFNSPSGNTSTPEERRNPIVVTRGIRYPEAMHIMQETHPVISEIVIGERSEGSNAVFSESTARDFLPAAQGSDTPSRNGEVKSDPLLNFRLNLFRKDTDKKVVPKSRFVRAMAELVMQDGTIDHLEVQLADERAHIFELEEELRTVKSEGGEDLGIAEINVDILEIELEAANEDNAFNTARAKVLMETVKRRIKADEAEINALRILLKEEETISSKFYRRIKEAESFTESLQKEVEEERAKNFVLEASLGTMQVEAHRAQTQWRHKAARQRAKVEGLQARERENLDALEASQRALASSDSEGDRAAGNAPLERHRNPQSPSYSEQPVDLTTLGLSEEMARDGYVPSIDEISSRVDMMELKARLSEAEAEALQLRSSLDQELLRSQESAELASRELTEVKSALAEAVRLYGAVNAKLMQMKATDEGLYEANEILKVRLERSETCARANHQKAGEELRRKEEFVEVLKADIYRLKTKEVHKGERKDEWDDTEETKTKLQIGQQRRTGQKIVLRPESQEGRKLRNERSEFGLFEGSQTNSNVNLKALIEFKQSQRDKDEKLHGLPQSDELEPGIQNVRNNFNAQNNELRSVGVESEMIVTEEFEDMRERIQNVPL